MTQRDARLAAVVIGALVLLALLLIQGRGPVTRAEGASAASTEPTTSAVERITRSDAEWKRVLSPEQYRVLREHGTEPPFHNAYWDRHDRGTFVCAGCGLELFESDKKFDSGTGWPSFWTHVANHVERSPDPDGSRTELSCARCGGHLGHVFDDGPEPTHLRYCINSAALNFVPAGK